MYRFPEVPQEHALMKKGGKIKQKQKQKQSVNIKNIITIDRKPTTRRKAKPAPKRQPQQTPPQTQYLGTGVQYPFINLLRPQSNDTRGVAFTGATATEANNNIMATIRKSQEITEGKLNARIDDMTSTIAGDYNTLSRVVLGIHQFLATDPIQEKGKQPPNQEQKEDKEEPLSKTPMMTRIYERTDARKRGAPIPPLNDPELPPFTSLEFS